MPHKNLIGLSFKLFVSIGTYKEHGTHSTGCDTIEMLSVLLIKGY